MTECGCRDDVDTLERRTLWMLLAINGVMFLAEAIIGWLAESTGLLADSLDMLADAMVYSTALYAVGRSTTLKHRAASVSGWIQIGLGIGVIIVQTLFSKYWLQSFKYGPLEWLWRCGTYLKWQPFKRTSLPAPVVQ